MFAWSLNILSRSGCCVYHGTRSFWYPRLVHESWHGVRNVWLLDVYCLSLFTIVWYNNNQTYIWERYGLNVRSWLEPWVSFYRDYFLGRSSAPYWSRYENSPLTPSSELSTSSYEHSFPYGEFTAISKHLHWNPFSFRQFQRTILRRPTPVLKLSRECRSWLQWRYRTACVCWPTTTRQAYPMISGSCVAH